MMALQDVQATLTSLLNRRDLTPALTATFLNQGQSRAQRLLRLPSMERAAVTTATTLPILSFPVPSDLVQFMDVFVNGWPLQHLAYRQLQRKVVENCGVLLTPATIPTAFPRTLQCPTEYFARIGSSLFVWPLIQPGGAAIVTYYGAFRSLVNPTDDNELTLDCPDVLIYGALSFGADYFAMDNKDVWEARFQQALMEVQDNASQLDMTGGSLAVQSSHGDY